MSEWDGEERKFSRMGQRKFEKLFELEGGSGTSGTRVVGKVRYGQSAVTRAQTHFELAS